MPTRVQGIKRKAAQPASSEQPTTSEVSAAALLLSAVAKHAVQEDREQQEQEEQEPAKRPAQRRGRAAAKSAAAIIEKQAAAQESSGEGDEVEVCGSAGLVPAVQAGQGVGCTWAGPRVRPGALLVLGLLGAVQSMHSRHPVTCTCYRGCRKLFQAHWCTVASH